jgi:hypothetical protein
VQAGEPARGIAAARRYPDPIAYAAAGDGSFLLGYQWKDGCYYRRVFRDGEVTGWFGHGGTGCPYLWGDATGYLGLDSEDPMRHSVDLSQVGQQPAVGAKAVRTPRPGDVYLEWCDDLAEEDALVVTDNDPAKGCAYSPATRSLYRLRPVLTIDPAGRSWALGGHRTLLITDGTTQRRTAPLPGRPDGVTASAGRFATVWLDDMRRLYSTVDSGRSWRQVTTLPPQGHDHGEDSMLADGRLVFNPWNGQLWRGTNRSNRSFEPVEAGPISTVAAGDDRLFGLAEHPRDPRMTGMVFMSQDAGSTWRPIVGRTGVLPRSRPVPANALRLPGGPSAAEMIRHLKPHDVAVTKDGLVLVTYGTDGGRTAWRLHDRHDRVVAQGVDAWGVTTAGDGFILASTQGLRFVDTTGRLTRVDWWEESRRPVTTGDVWVPEGVYRPSQRRLFIGTAQPNGAVSAADTHGRMWALARHTGTRTVVRSAVPGGPWSSRELGPKIGATDVQGGGSILMVVGPRQMYISADAGATWRLVTHGASVYDGLPQFAVRPDDSIIAGDERAGYRVSDDLRTFHKPTAADLHARVIGELFVRGPLGRLEISRDRVNWQPFTPRSIRRLLAP